MTNLTSLSAQQLRAAADIQDRIAALQAQLTKILGGTSGPASAPAGKRVMSAAGRARIAAAARARWAKVKRAKQPGKRAKRRRLSPAARARIAAVARQRWAKAKAAGRTRL